MAASENTQQIQYDTYYSLFMVDGVNKYVSWKVRWAYLYDVLKVLWFTRARGDSKGAILTGDQLLINQHTILGSPNVLNGRGVTNWTVAWAGDASSSAIWQIWNDTIRTPGKPIDLGQSIWITNVSYDGYLMQYVPEDLSYLTISPSASIPGTPSTFRILSQSGGVVADESDTKSAPPPPDTDK